MSNKGLENEIVIDILTVAACSCVETQVSSELSGSRGGSFVMSSNIEVLPQIDVNPVWSVRRTNE